MWSVWPVWFEGGPPSLSASGRSPAGDAPRFPPLTASRCWAAAAVMLSSALPHAPVLGLLEDLSLRGDRRSGHHLHVLELGDVVRAAYAQRRTQRPGEVPASVVHPPGAAQDLLHGRPPAPV